MRSTMTRSPTMTSRSKRACPAGPYLAGGRAFAGRRFSLGENIMDKPSGYELLRAAAGIVADLDAPEGADAATLDQRLAD